MNDYYGHLLLLGIGRYWRPHLTERLDTPNALVLDAALRQGGTTSYPHPINLQGAPPDTEPPGSLDEGWGELPALAVESADIGIAREFPVDAALGKVHGLDVLSYPSNDNLTLILWYRLLNCGLRVTASAGTDAFLNRRNGFGSNPLGGHRVFVRCGEKFDAERWLQAYRDGATFVTNGPLLLLRVNGPTRP